MDSPVETNSLCYLRVILYLLYHGFPPRIANGKKRLFQYQKSSETREM